MELAKTVRGFVQKSDLRLMRRVHRWRAPRWLRRGTLLATRLGNGWAWYVLGLAILFFGGERRYVALGSGLTACVTGIFLFRGLKHLSKRPRPCQIEPHCWAMISPPDRFSFPSGHSMTSFAIAVSIGHFYPELQLLLLLLAASIAASRIILGMHFLTDVIAGAAIGVGLGLASFCLFG
jgi:undecaprenyl-diphosphatase